MNLKSAYREIGFRCKHFMKMKQSKTPDDVFSLVDAIENRDDMDCVVRLDSHAQIQSVINNPKILKRYFSEEIHENKKYLGLMVLGLEFLRMTANFEDEEEARKILHDKIQEEIKKTMED